MRLTGYRQRGLKTFSITSHFVDRGISPQLQQKWIGCINFVGCSLCILHDKALKGRTLAGPHSHKVFEVMYSYRDNNYTASLSKAPGDLTRTVTQALVT